MSWWTERPKPTCEYPALNPVGGDGWDDSTLHTHDDGRICTWDKDALAWVTVRRVPESQWQAVLSEAGKRRRAHWQMVAVMWIAAVVVVALLVWAVVASARAGDRCRDAGGAYTGGECVVKVRLT